MLFIPQEVKEKIDLLEEDNKRLLDENNHLKEEAADSISRQKKSSPSLWLVALLIVAIAYIVYLQLQNIKQKKEIAAAQTESVEAVIIRDGKIEKWNAKAMEGIVYRVQLGAYEGFDLEDFKQNLDGVHQDDFDGYSKLSLGAFSRLEDAQLFLQNMLSLELENVFIVAYKNNEPIGLIEAKNLE